jgi:hypothetical protein
VIESTWEWRELPVLKALYAREETQSHALPHPSPKITVGLDEIDAVISDQVSVQEFDDILRIATGPPSLGEIYAGLVDGLAQETMLTRDEVYRTLWRLHHDGYLVDERLSGRGLRAIGAWPSENSYDAILRVLERRIEAEQDPDTRSRLRQFLSFLQGLGREVGTSLLTEWLKRSTGLA